MKGICEPGTNYAKPHKLDPQWRNASRFKGRAAQVGVPIETLLNDETLERVAAHRERRALVAKLLRMRQP